MPKRMRQWIGRETTLTVGGQTYRGKVVQGDYVNERDWGRQNREQRGENGNGYDKGYAFQTKDWELIRLFLHRYPRVVVRGEGLAVVDSPQQ